MPGEPAALREVCERYEIRIAAPEVREVLREAQDTNATLDFVRTVSTWVEDESDTVTVSIGLKNVGFRVGAQNPVDTSPEAQAAYTRQPHPGSLTARQPMQGPVSAVQTERA